MAARVLRGDPPLYGSQGPEGDPPLYGRGGGGGWTDSREFTGVYTAIGLQIILVMIHLQFQTPNLKTKCLLEVAFLTGIEPVY